MTYFKYLKHHEAMADSAKSLEDSLILIWNDKNAARRLQNMQNVYAADISFHESPVGETIIGREGLNNVISKLQENWPPDFEFMIEEPAIANRDLQHITWVLGVPGQDPVAVGIDLINDAFDRCIYYSMLTRFDHPEFENENSKKLESRSSNRSSIKQKLLLGQFVSMFFKQIVRHILRAIFLK